MSIQIMDSYPALSWRQKLLRRILGGQDIVLVTYLFSDGTSTYKFYTGVDMSNPLHRETFPRIGGRP